MATGAREHAVKERHDEGGEEAHRGGCPSRESGRRRTFGVESRRRDMQQLSRIRAHRQRTSRHTPRSSCATRRLNPALVTLRSALSELFSSAQSRADGTPEPDPGVVHFVRLLAEIPRLSSRML